MGGNRHGNEGFFVQPTVFTDTKPDMKIVTEEIFGPVVVLSKFEDDEGALNCSGGDQSLMLYRHYPSSKRFYVWPCRSCLLKGRHPCDQCRPQIACWNRLGK